MLAVKIKNRINKYLQNEEMFLITRISDTRLDLDCKALIHWKPDNKYGLQNITLMLKTHLSPYSKTFFC